MRMPGVAEVAVVAAPDARLGEIGVRALPHARPARRAPDLVAIRDDARSAPAWPSRSGPSSSATIDEFPRTPSGKVQKFVLRQRLRDEAPAA